MGFDHLLEEQKLYKHNFSHWKQWLISLKWERMWEVEDMLLCGYLPLFHCSQHNECDRSWGAEERSGKSNPGAGLQFDCRCQKQANIGRRKDDDEGWGGVGMLKSKNFKLKKKIREGSCPNNTWHTWVHGTASSARIGWMWTQRVLWVVEALAQNSAGGNVPSSPGI